MTGGFLGQFYSFGKQNLRHFCYGDGSRQYHVFEKLILGMAKLTFIYYLQYMNGAKRIAIISVNVQTLFRISRYPVEFLPMLIRFVSLC